LQVQGDWTVALLKERLEAVTAIPVANQKLLWKGKALHDQYQSLEEVGLSHQPAGRK
jgi:Ubiquitin family